MKKGAVQAGEAVPFFIKSIKCKTLHWRFHRTVLHSHPLTVSDIPNAISFSASKHSNSFSLNTRKAHLMLVIRISQISTAESLMKAFSPRTLDRQPISTPSTSPGSVTTLYVGLSQLTLHGSLGAVSQTQSRSKLPRLLDDKGPGWVGLLHSGAHLAVPHAHWSLREVVAQLQTGGRPSAKRPETNPVCSAELHTTHKGRFLFLFTLSSVPVRRMPNCCILLAVVAALLQGQRFQTQKCQSYWGGQFTPNKIVLKCMLNSVSFHLFLWVFWI